jgi:hypothetical protein
VWHRQLCGRIQSSRAVPRLRTWPYFCSTSSGLSSTDTAPSMCAQRLLAYLALTGGRLRSVGACALWPDVLDAQALASLRTAIWRADRCVNGIVSRDSSSIALAGFVTVDVADLVEHASQLLGSAASSPGGHRSDTVRVSPELVIEFGGRSELLPGWHDWVECEREHLRQLRLHALEAASSRMLRLGQFSLALERRLRGCPLGAAPRDGSPGRYRGPPCRRQHGRGRERVPPLSLALARRPRAGAL